MSIPDELMWTYYELLTDFDANASSPPEKRSPPPASCIPWTRKCSLAHDIIAGFHGEEAARKAAENEFQRVFRDRQAPEDAPWKKLPRSESKRLSTLLAEVNLASSRAEAERLIKQGGVEVNGKRVDDVKHEVDLSQTGASFLLRAGKKKFLRVIVE